MLVTVEMGVGIERAIWQILGMFSVHHLPIQQFCSWTFVLNKCPVGFMRGHSLFV